MTRLRPGALRGCALLLVALSSGAAAASDRVDAQLSGHVERAKRIGARFVNRSMGSTAAKDQDVRWQSSRKLDARTYKRGGAVRSELLARSGEHWDSFAVYRNTIVERDDGIAILRTHEDGSGRTQSTAVLSPGLETHSTVHSRSSIDYNASRTSSRRLRLNDESVAMLREVLGAAKVKAAVVEREPVLLTRDAYRTYSYGMVERTLKYHLVIDHDRTEIPAPMAEALSLHVVGR